MSSVIVDHLDEDRFAVAIRGHRLIVDQPRSEGGGDAGPTPTELFVAGLAACIAHYARGYLARHGLPTRDLQVTAEFDLVPRLDDVPPIRMELVRKAGTAA